MQNKLSEPPKPSVLNRGRTEGEKRSEAVLSADDRQQMPLGGADHPDGRLLGRGPSGEARLRPHQDLHGQTQQVRRTPHLKRVLKKSQKSEITTTLDLANRSFM